MVIISCPECKEYKKIMLNPISAKMYCGNCGAEFEADEATLNEVDTVFDMDAGRE